MLALNWSQTSDLPWGVGKLDSYAYLLHSALFRVLQFYRHLTMEHLWIGQSLIEIMHFGHGYFLVTQ